MKKSLKSRHDANKRIHECLNEYSSRIESVPILVAFNNDLGVNNDKADALLIKVENIPLKTAGNKKLAKEDLVPILVKASNMLKVYANVNRDKNLHNLLITASSSLSSDTKDSELISYAENMYSRILSLGEVVKTFGWTTELTEELITELNDFKAVVSEPRKLIEDRKTSKELLEDTIAETGLLCRESIAPLMELFIDDKEFYLAFKAASMIIDPATRSKKQSNEENTEE
nr:hypothetical protein [uncultured Carboxylicivirga sp.]